MRVHISVPASPGLFVPQVPFVCLLLLRPPRPTLFPYTTLFRSSIPQRLTVRKLDVDAGVVLRETGHLASGIEDRKSTRLNSSHANISYAVFCLKKKNDMPRHNALTGREHVPSNIARAALPAKLQ